MRYKDGIEGILDFEIPEGDKTIRDVVKEDSESMLETLDEIKQGWLSKSTIKYALRYLVSRSGRWPSIYTKAKKELRRTSLEKLRDGRRIKSFLNRVFDTRGTKAYRMAKEGVPSYVREIERLNDEIASHPKKERLDFFEERFDELLGKTVGIGVKGRDSILRDFGFFSRVPIDVHERRFLLRTGIFNDYALPDRSDPTDDGDLVEALRCFCKNELPQTRIGRIPLSEAPGLLDLAIWYFSQEGTERDISLRICARKPKCAECPMKKVCHFGKVQGI